MSHPDAQALKPRLESKSIDELRTIAKKLNLTGYSGLRKADLVALLISEVPDKLGRVLCPTWWTRHYGHVYGIASIVGLILTVAFFLWPSSRETPIQVPVPVPKTIEKPVRFADYAAMAPDKQNLIFTAFGKERFLWEGYLRGTVGFRRHTQEGVPFDTEVGIQIKPSLGVGANLIVEVQFGKLLPTDSGYALALQLDSLDIDQRIRVSGLISGTPEKPVLTNGWLEAVFPLGE